MSSMHRAMTFLALFALALTILGCGKAAQVHVTKRLTVKLAEYPVASIEVSGAGPKQNRATSKFESILGKTLKEAGVFQKIDSDGSIVLRCRITHMEYGDEAQRELSLHGKAKATIEIHITEPDGNLVGHITVTAQANRKGEDDQPAVRALQRAADAVAEYLKERMTSIEKAPEKQRKRPTAKQVDEVEEQSTGDDEKEEPEEKPEEETSY